MPLVVVDETRVDANFFSFFEVVTSPSCTMPWQLWRPESAAVSVTGAEAIIEFWGELAVGSSGVDAENCVPPKVS